MNRKLQFAIVWTVAIAISAFGSHILINWLKIETTSGRPWSIAPANGRPMAYLAGSSLARDGLSSERITKELDVGICGWGIAGGSPFEWEVFQPRATEARMSLIVVSAYDLDEANLCDYRADLVPFTHTLRALRASQADWSYTKRSLSQYATRWLRLLFPTLGRSKGVMGDLRIKLSKVLSRSPADESEAGPRLSVGTETAVPEYRKGRISDWSKAKTLGKLSAVRSALQGNQSFSGPKKLALQHMLQYGDTRGRVIAVMLPVSPAYAGEFTPPVLQRQFEDSLADVQRSAPRAQWVRLDQLPALNSNDNFYDLVHMNPSGQKIATEAFLSWLKQTAAPL